MSEWLERITHARTRVSPEWTPTRERALRLKIERRLERRRMAVRAFGSAVLVVAALVLGRAGYGIIAGQKPIAARAETRRDGQQLLQLQDGTVVTALSADAQIEPVEIAAHAVVMRLNTGAAHFEVTHREDRRFTVRAKDVSVNVLGTAFTVRLLGDGVKVSVDRGKVDVAWQGIHRKLVAGEEVLASAATATAAKSTESVPTAKADPAAAPSTVDGDSVVFEETLPEAAANPAAAIASAHPISNAQPTWRTLAQEGDYRGAFARMSQEGSSAVRDNPGDLLFAADVARLSGHAELAVPRLERVIKAFGKDSRAPLAAFTLGRTLLDGLGRPREAAEAFARARRLAPGGALAQDALAREVESWSRAGDSALAHQRAVEYLGLYPGGRREKAVRFHGGVE